MALIGWILSFTCLFAGLALRQDLPIGGSVTISNLLIIFALLAGGALFGFTGVLLAIPAAAIIGVLIRFGLSRYLESPLYHGGQALGNPMGKTKAKSQTRAKAKTKSKSRARKKK